jgi:hypothetical protein
MSRSYKKVPIGKSSITGLKAYASRLKRKAEKLSLLKALYEEDEPEPVNKNQVVNSYDICDQKWVCDGDCRCIAEYGRKKCLQK